jgi:hypothetical protein
VVVLGGVRPGRTRDPRQGRTVNFFESVLHP